jgi:hypothetical protein
MASITQSQILSDLNFLLGNTTVPSQVTDQEDYIQKTLERIFRNYNFPMNTVLATIQMTAGIGTLPTNVGQDGLLDVREVNAGPYTDNVYVQVSYAESNNFSVGDYAYWLQGYEGNYTIYTSETSGSDPNPILTLLYTTSVPVLNASINTNFPSSMAVALGALKYYRLAEDPYTDVTPYENMFQLEMAEVIANVNRNRAQPRGITQLEQWGTYTGDITTVGAYVGNVGMND